MAGAVGAAVTDATASEANNGAASTTARRFAVAARLAAVGRRVPDLVAVVAAAHVAEVSLLGLGALGGGVAEAVAVVALDRGGVALVLLGFGALEEAVAGLAAVVADGLVTSRASASSAVSAAATVVGVGLCRLEAIAVLTRQVAGRQGSGGGVVAAATAVVVRRRRSVVAVVMVVVMVTTTVMVMMMVVRSTVVLRSAVVRVVVMMVMVMMTIRRSTACC